MVGLCIIYLSVSSVQNLAFMHMTMRRAGLRLDWLLIDAEGYEINALNGAGMYFMLGSTFSSIFLLRNCTFYLKNISILFLP
jgi:hypothetical protein